MWTSQLQHVTRYKRARVVSTSVAIRKHIKMSMYQETSLTSMGMFGNKRGHFGDKYSNGLSFVKLLMDTLVTTTWYT